MLGPQTCNIAEVESKDCKIAFMNRIEVLKLEMTKSLKGIYGNPRKQWKESSRVASGNNFNKGNVE